MSPIEKNVHTTAIEEAGDGTTAQEQILRGSGLVLCTFALLISIFLVALDQTIVVTILSVVGNKFSDFSKIGWISSGFLLPTAVLAPSWGKVSLVFGRKHTLLVGIFLFELGSLICGLSSSMDMLIGGRVLAGMGGGGIQVMVFIIMTEIVEIQMRGFIQGIVGASFGIASVVGPLIGGAFSNNLSWRWCFYVNLPVGGLAALCIWTLFNPPPPTGSLTEKLQRIDYVGTLLLTVGLVLVLLALTFGSSTFAWNSPLVITFFVCGGIICMVFSVYNFGYSQNPLIPLRVVRIPTVAAPLFVLGFVFASFFSAVIYLSTYFQVVLNADAMKSGIYLLPMIVALVVASLISGTIISKVGYTKAVAILGTLSSAVGFGLCSTLNESSQAQKRIGYQILAGTGIGCLFQSITLNTQTAAPKTDGGVLTATTMLAFFRSIGGVLGSTIGQTIENVVFKNQLANVANGRDLGKSEIFLNAPDTIRRYLSPEEVEIVIEQFIIAFQRVMYFSTAFMIGAFATSLFLTNEKIQKKAIIIQSSHLTDREANIDEAVAAAPS